MILEKEKYEKPEMELIQFESEDVITASSMSATSMYNSVDGFWDDSIYTEK